MKNDTSANSYPAAKAISEVLNNAVKDCAKIINKTNRENEGFDLDVDLHLQGVVICNEGDGSRSAGKVCASTDETGLDAVSFGLEMFGRFLDEGVTHTPEELSKRLAREGYGEKSISALIKKLAKASGLLRSMEAINNPEKASISDLEDLLRDIKNNL